MILADQSDGSDRKQMTHEALSERGTRAQTLVREHARPARHHLDFVVHAEPGLAAKAPGHVLVATRSRRAQENPRCPA